MNKAAKIAALRDISSQEPINYCQFVMKLHAKSKKYAKLMKK